MTITSNINKKSLALNLFIPLVIGGVSALITNSGYKDYQAVMKPVLSPPSWLFPVVWTILYILMGISAYIISERDKTDSKKALGVYAIQLFINFIWSILFFSLKAYLISFIWLLLLWVAIIVMIYEFSKISKTAGLLQIPYLLWVTFAAYLNLSVYLLNG